MEKENKFILYNTVDGKACVALYARDGNIWLNQNQLAELFATSKQSISYHILNILKDNELDKYSVVKDYLTTASDGKQYNVVFYSLEMIMAIGFQVRSIRGTQFRQWAGRLSSFRKINTEMLITPRIKALCRDSPFEGGEGGCCCMSSVCDCN